MPRSTPAQNARPSARTTTTRTLSSNRISSARFPSCREASHDQALSLSGRSSVRVAMPSSTASRSIQSDSGSTGSMRTLCFLGVVPTTTEHMTTRQKTRTPALMGNVGTCSTAPVGRMKIVVDRGECEANAVCAGILPEVFEVDDDDNLVVHEDHPPDDKLSKVREAVDSCPKRALALKEVDE